MKIEHFAGSKMSEVTIIWPALQLRTTDLGSCAKGGGSLLA
jgi:hypothetical protein